MKTISNVLNNEAWRSVILVVIALIVSVVQFLPIWEQRIEHNTNLGLDVFRKRLKSGDFVD